MGSISVETDLGCAFHVLSSLMFVPLSLPFIFSRHIEGLTEIMHISCLKLSFIKSLNSQLQIKSQSFS